jgi:hypothetical protein
MVRAIGPSLQAFGVSGALQDPTLDLVQSGASIGFNDNWKDSPERPEIEASTIPPSHDFESAIVRTLNPGPYTAIMRGKDDTTGVGLVEVLRSRHLRELEAREHLDPRRRAEWRRCHDRRHDCRRRDRFFAPGAHPRYRSGAHRK